MVGSAIRLFFLVFENYLSFYVLTQKYNPVAARDPPPQPYPYSYVLEPGINNTLEKAIFCLVHGKDITLISAFAT